MPRDGESQAAHTVCHRKFSRTARLNEWLTLPAVRRSLGDDIWLNTASVMSNASRQLEWSPGTVLITGTRPSLLGATQERNAIPQ